MSFTVKILNVDKKDLGLKITVKLTDGDDVRTEAYLFTGKTKKQLKAFILSKTTRTEDIKDIDFSNLIGKVFDLTPDPVTPPPDPTPEEIAKTAWFKDWYKLDSLIHLANNGLIQPDDSRITALQTSLKTDWLNSYLGDI